MKRVEQPAKRSEGKGWPVSVSVSAASPLSPAVFSLPRLFAPPPLPPFLLPSILFPYLPRSTHVITRVTRNPAIVRIGSVRVEDDTVERRREGGAGRRGTWAAERRKSGALWRGIKCAS